MAHTGFNLAGKTGQNLVDAGLNTVEHLTGGIPLVGGLVKHLGHGARHIVHTALETGLGTAQKATLTTTGLVNHLLNGGGHHHGYVYTKPHYYPQVTE